MRDGSGYLRGESGYLRGESGYLRGESGYLRGESGYLRGESGYLRDESDYLRGESDYLRQGDPARLEACSSREAGGGTRRPKSGILPVACLGFGYDIYKVNYFLSLVALLMIVMGYLALAPDPAPPSRVAAHPVQSPPEPNDEDALPYADTIDRMLAQEPNPLVDGLDFSAALSSGRPTLAVFGTSWCPACQYTQPHSTYLRKKRWPAANVVEIDCDRFRPLQNAHKVDRYPTIIVFDRSGKEVSRHVGGLDWAAMSAMLDAVK